MIWTIYLQNYYMTPLTNFIIIYFVNGSFVKILYKNSAFDYIFGET